jgi:hypothetical protein
MGPFAVLPPPLENPKKNALKCSAEYNTQQQLPVSLSELREEHISSTITFKSLI